MFYSAAIDRYFISQKERCQRQSAGKANRFGEKMVLYQRRKRVSSTQFNSLLTLSLYNHVAHQHINYQS